MREYQNISDTLETTTNDVANKPEHVIEAKISIEVTGEDEPTKYDKRRERWGAIAFWSLVALVLSIISFFIAMNAYSLFAIVISVVVSGYSLANACYIDPEEPTGPMPWYYGAL